MKKLCVLFTICLMLLSACQRNSGTDFEEKTSDTSFISEETEETEETKDPDFYDKPFDFSASLNMFNNKNNSLMPCCCEFKTPENKLLPFTMYTRCSPDESVEDKDNIPADIYVFGDGKLLEFRLSSDTESGSFATVNRVYLKAEEDTYFDVQVNLDTGSQIKVITVLINYYPEYMPFRGLGQIDGTLTYSFKNTDCSFEASDIQTGSDFYLTIPGLSTGGSSVELGNIGLSETDNNMTENHMYYDVDLSQPDKDSLYIKFNSGDDMPYYAVAFCDGKLMNIFDGAYSYAVNCHNGEKTFQYKIPEELIPEQGLHTFQAVFFPALPYSDKEDNPSVFPNHTSTIKVRVHTDRKK